MHGRSIAYRLLDDAGDPLAVTQRLVEEDAVLALVGSSGADQTVGVRSYLNSAGVPQLFVDSAAETLGREQRRFPWTIGFRPSHRAEGWIYGSYLARTRRKASVGVLVSDDEAGRELLAGLRQGLVRSTVRVVAIRAGDAAVDSDVAELQAAGADVLAVFVDSAAAASTAARRLRWRPHVLVRSDAPGATDGAVSLAYVKDPADPAWRDDRAIRRYRAIMSRYAPGTAIGDLRHVEGMAAAYEFVRVLQAVGKQPTRARLLAAVRALNDASNPFLLPGIVVRTGAGDPFPVEQAELRRWSQGRWRRFGGLWAHRAG